MWPNNFDRIWGFKSADNGNTWQTIDYGMNTNSRVMQLVVNNNVLFGGTKGRRL
ncbi:hypothetical protein [Flavobacterium sp.]|uniref:hypothetical protein n=1 Tax=Flavobacterium sp. TaxID=239 RepID=UPI0037BF760B